MALCFFKFIKVMWYRLYYSLLFLVLFVLFYVLLSLLGLLFSVPLRECFNGSWFIIYSLLFGWWIPLVLLEPYYDKYIKNDC